MENNTLFWFEIKIEEPLILFNNVHLLRGYSGLEF